MTALVWMEAGNQPLPESPGANRKRLTPSEMACLDSSPGRIRRTEVWISREEMVLFLLYDASLDASPAASRQVSFPSRLLLQAKDAPMRSKMSLTNELRMSIALFEIPVSGWTCLRTL